MKLGLVLSVCFLFVLGVFLVEAVLQSCRGPAEALFAKISVGDSEEAVRGDLGEPVFEYTAESAPVDYYVKGYRYRARPVTGKVLIYLEDDLILYVWLNRDHVVEEVFVGAS